MCGIIFHLQAYASYMKGTLLFEQDKNWETALVNFKNARYIFPIKKILPSLVLLGDVDAFLLIPGINGKLGRLLICAFVQCGSYSFCFYMFGCALESNRICWSTFKILVKFIDLNNYPF